MRAADKAASPLLRCLNDSITITANDHTYTEHVSAVLIHGLPPFPGDKTLPRRDAGSGGSVSQRPVTHRLPLTAGAIRGRWCPVVCLRGRRDAVFFLAWQARRRGLAAPPLEAACGYAARPGAAIAEGLTLR
jgi:hypothetical protein